MACPAQSITPALTWPARLELVFERRGTRTALARCAHQGPLRVQRPFYPEGGPCHVYVLHPPGGVVGGDTLAIEATVHPGAHALLTTPAATKFYRSDGRLAGQQQRLRVSGGAALEWLPQDSIVFNGAIAELGTHIELAHDARFIGWELSTLGRPACGETFDAGRLRQRLELWRGGVPFFIERSQFRGNGRALTAPWGLNGRAAFATMVATPVDTRLLDRARTAVAAHSPSGAIVAFTLKGDVLVGRGIAPGALALQHTFTAVWRAIRKPLLGCEPCEPRIWRT